MSGEFVMFAAGSVLMTLPDGRRDSHPVGHECQVTLNGVPCDIRDLKPGDRVSMSGDPATSVVAVRD